MQMWQLRNESFRVFAARVRGKAGTCTFSVDCTCALKVKYTDHMIHDTLRNGIADHEIRREVVGNADVLTRAVNEIVALVESKEMACNAVLSTEVTSVSAVKRLHDENHRARRNATSYTQFNNLPARSKQWRCPLCQRLYRSTKKGLVVGIPSLIPCVMNAIRYRNTKDVISLLKWTLYHLSQPTNS